MKSLLMLLNCVLSSESALCHVSATRDLKTIASRFEHEGISFITITMPKFGSDFEKSLDQGFVDRQSFLGFSRKGELPRFLGGFLDLVFDRSSGRLVDDPRIDAIRAVRQITLMFSRIEIECSERRKRSTIKGYVDCEDEVVLNDSYFDSYKAEFIRIGHLVYGNMFSKLNLMVQHGDILPRHGSGATADRLKGNRKFDQTEWPERLDELFPAMEFLSPRWDVDFPSRVHYIEPGQERPVKVVLVPKTLKKPRVIAEEPTAMQYVQQGLFEVMQEAIRGDDILRWLICSDSQVPNQELARMGSITGALATLDLSEASDRVSNRHVQALLSFHPFFAAGVEACRSRKADVPGYGVLPLAKFASMGSALCFPFEAIVFSVVILMGIQSVLNRPLTRRDILSLQGRVRVYGDDIIVPVEYTSSVVAYLQTFGFKVNASKSFWTGKFRESCGKDYYDGHDVSVVRLKQLIPSQRRPVRKGDRRFAEQLASLVSFRNRCFTSGMWSVTRYLDPIIEGIIPFPVGLDTSPALVKISALPYKAERTDRDLQRPLIKGAVLVPVIPKSNLSGDGALMKFFLKRGIEPYADVKHLERAGRPVSVDIKIRYVTPF